MRAAAGLVLNSPLRIETIADPEPAGHEVVIKVGRCGICGSNLHKTEGPMFGIKPWMCLGTLIN